MSPKLSKHFESRQPSAIRLAQIEHSKRTDDVYAVNTAIGNVSLSMHPKLRERMFNLNSDNSPFKDGVNKYTATVGMEETNKAFLNIISSSGFKTDKLYSQVTFGGSAAMDLVVLGVCGEAGSGESPLLLIDAAYTNYNAMALGSGRKNISITRTLNEDGKFSMPDVSEIEKIIEQYKPGGMVVIPYDNPTGHFYDHDTMVDLGKLCVEYDMWMVSDEAYRELFYDESKVTSIWGLTEQDVPGITGKRISIETASKVWNACGLRIGALVTDNEQFHKKSVAEFTKLLCAPAIDQYIFGALAHETHEDLKAWYDGQRDYYKPLMTKLTSDFKEMLPGVIVSRPDASIYSVVDVRNLVDDGFDAKDFVLYCATKGKVDVDGKDMTLLVAPMDGFYNVASDQKNPGKTQMRIAYVAKPEEMSLVPKLFTGLFNQYKASKNSVEKQMEN